MKIAIIGSGISGLGAANRLCKNHDITIFEKESSIGGHATTIEVSHDGTTIAVDIGVNVFSERDYPNILKLFRSLNVPLKKCKMSFSMSLNGGEFEWSSLSLLANGKNFFRFGFLAMLFDFLRLYIYVKTHTVRKDITMEKFLEDLRFSHEFKHWFLLPIASAIWTCSASELLKFPAHTLITFLDKHGLLNIFSLTAWYTIPGGCRVYLDRLSKLFEQSIRLNCPVYSVKRTGAGVEILSQKGSESFDAVIFACHPDDILKLLVDATIEEQEVFGVFKFVKNDMYTHTDASVMPKSKLYWASQVYSLRTKNDTSRSSINYFVNRHQNRMYLRPLFISINPFEPIPERFVLDRRFFSHPVFDLASVEAQKRLPTIQGKNRAWYCGAYTGYGFHEDGLVSGMKVADAINLALK